MKRIGYRVFALLALLAVAVAPVFAGSSEPARDTIKRSFAVDRNGTLVVDVDFGNVTIQTSNDNMVYVEIERLLDESNETDVKSILSRHEWEIERTGNGVIVESRFNRDQDDDGWLRRRRSNNLRINVTVTVPVEYNVDFKTGAGKVSVADLTGRIDGVTGAGHVGIGQITGSIEIRSGSGNIDVDGVSGSVEMTSGAGNMTIGSVSGELNARTGAGNIDVYLAGQPTSDSHVESGAGSVTVFLDNGTGVDVDAHASVGSASCDFGLDVEGKWMSKSFGGEVNGGGPLLTLRTGVGNVALKRR